MLLEPIESFLRNGLDRCSQLSIESEEKVVGQFGNVFHAITKRGKVKCHPAQAVVKIATKSPVFDHGIQILVGRGNDSHIHGESFVPADPLELPPL